MNTPNTAYTSAFFATIGAVPLLRADAEAQVDAGIEMTLDICRRHGVEPLFFWPSTTYSYPRFQVATIVCHSSSSPTAQAHAIMLHGWEAEVRRVRPTFGARPRDVGSSRKGSTA